MMMGALFIGFILLIALLAIGSLTLLFGLAHYYVTNGYVEGWLNDEEVNDD